MNLKVSLYQADGTPHALGVLDLPCKPVPANQVISSATASGSASTTQVTAAPASATAGGSTTVTAKVSGPVSTPAGTVRFTWAGGTRTVALAGGSARVAIPGLRAGSLRVTAAYIPSAIGAHKPSSGSVTIGVRKIKTATKVKFKGKKGKKGTVTVTVNPKATGKVTVKVKGAVKKTLRGTVRKGKVTLKLGKLKKKGKITVVATFAGSATHDKSVSRKAKFRIK